MVSESRVERLYSPHRVHGKIGVVFGSGEERIQPEPEVNVVDGLEVRTTHKVVTRPEVVFTVEQPPPPPASTGKFISFDQFKKMGQNPRNRQSAGQGQDPDIMEITLEPTESSKSTPTGETYQGESVMKGPRGGKFIIKDGKKKYVQGSGGGDGESSGVVYNINILESGAESDVRY
jgi:hypothetical protein